MRALLAGGSALCLTLLLAASPARAALTASELALDAAVLNQFNVVTIGDYAANSETEGRVAVGGNFSGSNGNVCFNGCSGDTTPIGGVTYGGLNVWGSVSGGASDGGSGADFFIQGNNAGNSTLQMQHDGGVGIAGTNSGTINSATFINVTSPGAVGSTQNAGSINSHALASTAFPFASTIPFGSALSDLASGIAADAAATNAQTLGAHVQNGPTSITANAANGSYNGKQYGFITTTVADLASQQSFGGINVNGLDAVFVVVTGSGTLPTLNTNDSNVIWDFVDATSLTFGGSWHGQILAPNAMITNNSDLNGAVFAKSIVQNAEIHDYDNGGDILPTNTLSGLPTYEGAPVAEPSALAVLVVGIFGLGFAWRRRVRSTA